MSARIAGVAVSLAALAALAACGPQETVTAPEKPAQATSCEKASTALVDTIASVLVDGRKVKRAAAMRSADFDRAWFVAALVEGVPEPVVHVTNDLDGSGLLYSVGGFGHQFSTVGHGEDTGAKFSTGSDGYDAAVECVGSEAR